jgi:SAM-dependent methyltransferase
VNRADSLNGEWIQLAPAWIREAREGHNASRKGLLDQPMLDACGNVSGLKILDCGCGEGRFCRILAERGAEFVLGVDLCEPMIAAARELQGEKDTYDIGDVQDLSFLENVRFDLAVSYLNQCDLLDFQSNTREVFRVLKPGGRFIIANVHPMRSAAGVWCTAEDGTKQHVILDRYFDESARQWQMKGIDITNFHRTLSTYTHAYRESGFTIESIIEPMPEEKILELYPELDDERRVPNFIIFVLKKT